MARPDDELPEIEVVGGAREARTEVEVESVPSRSRRSRTPWIIGAAFVAIVTVVGFASRDEGSADDDAAPSSTSTSRSTTSRSVITTRPTTTVRETGEYLTGGPAPVLGEPVGASVLLVSDSPIRWRQLNLETGWIVDLPSLRRVETWAMIPVENGVVAPAPTGLQIVTLPPVVPGQSTEPIGSALNVEGLDEAQDDVRVVSAGRPDRLWAITGPRVPEARQTATLIDIDGSALASFEPLAPWSAAANSLGMLFNAGSQGYLVSEDGVTGLGAGTILAGNGPFAGRAVCDTAMRCRQEIVDVRTGGTTRGGELPARLVAEGSVAMTQAEDGSLATVVYPDSRSTQSEPSSIYVTTPDGRSLEASVEGHRSVPVWLPRNLGLLVLTDQGLMHYVIDGDRLESHLVPGLLPEGATYAMFVPHGPSSSDP